MIAAHPDDEVLGCGGTIALHVAAGDEVYAAIACEGGVGQAAGIEPAARTLGIRDVRRLGFADERLDTVTLTDLITPLELVVREVRPDVVYCQHGGDLNRDHELVFKAALVATRPTEDCITAVYAFDTASSTEWGYPHTFVPDTWVDISRTLETKIAAMACYASEVRTYPHPRSLEALRHRALAWGHRHCLEAAEVFVTVRRTLRNGQAPV